ncbi:MAG: NUDIX hydrolase [Myxococcota bacterium]
MSDHAKTPGRLARDVLWRGSVGSFGIEKVELPGGHRGPGEDPQLCGTRELEEETGYRARRVERSGEILTSPGFSDERIHLFCAWELEPGTVRHEPSELIEVRELRLEQALDMVATGEIVDAKSIVALQHAARRVARGLG